MPFGQTLAGFVSEQGAVEELGRLQIKGPIEQQLPPRGFQQILAANHLSDLHSRVVHHDCEMV